MNVHEEIYGDRTRHVVGRIELHGAVCYFACSLLTVRVLRAVEALYVCVGRLFSSEVACCNPPVNLLWRARTRFQAFTSDVIHSPTVMSSQVTASAFVLGRLEAVPTEFNCMAGCMTTGRVAFMWSISLNIRTPSVIISVASG